MIKAYPWILDLFAIVADKIHAELTPAQTLGYIKRQHQLELGRIDTKHLPDVLKKLLDFAKSIYEPKPIPAPERCPACASIDATADRCGWCHSEIAG